MLLVRVGVQCSGDPCGTRLGGGSDPGFDRPSPSDRGVWLYPLWIPLLRCICKQMEPGESERPLQIMYSVIQRQHRFPCPQEA